MIFSANVSILLEEVPLLERFGLAAAAGFSAVEFSWPGHEAEPGMVERAALEGLGYDGLRRTGILPDDGDHRK